MENYENYGKVGKKLLFELGKLCPGVGILVSFSRPGGPEFCTEKLSGGGDFDGKN